VGSPPNSRRVCVERRGEEGVNQKRNKPKEKSGIGGEEASPEGQVKKGGPSFHGKALKGKGIQKQRMIAWKGLSQEPGSDC